MRIVAAVPAAGLLVGSALGVLLSDSDIGVHTWCPALAGLSPLAIVCVLLLVCVAVAILAWRRRRSRTLTVVVALGFFCGGLLLASADWQRAWRPPLRIAFEQLARGERRQAENDRRRLPEDDEAFGIVEGVLRGDASPGESGVSLTVDADAIDGTRTRGGIVATVAGSLAGSRLDDWRAGRRVRMPIMLRRPSRYLDPGVPDHERGLARRGVSLVGSVKSGALVDLMAHGNVVDEMFGALRGFARRAIAAAVGRWNPQSAAIVAAIVIGDRAGLDEQVQRRLQEAGTYHVIAISGGNIAILAGLLVSLFRIGGWLGRAAMVSAIVALSAYARLVGGGASVDRATLMAVVHFSARAVDQRSPPLNTLAVVAAILVAADPLAVVDPAFVLTFGATLGILLVMPIVALLTASGKTLLRPVVGLLAASVAAEVLLFPVAALIFSRVTFAGLALNFVAIPLMGVAQIAGMALVPVAVVSPWAAALIGWVAHLGASGLVRSADLVKFAPLLSYRIAPPAWTVVVCYYMALAGWWTLRRRPFDKLRAAPSGVEGRRTEIRGSAESSVERHVRRSAAAVASVAAMWILFDPRSIAAARGDGRLHATFLDVGQGDGIFIVFPRGSTLLVDAGGLSSSSSFDIGDRVVAPVIRHARFYRIDTVALTHGDPDHIGGAASIVSEFRPREVWEGIPVPRSEALTALRRQTEAAGARWLNVYAGDRRSIDGVDVIAHHPSVADWERQKVRNDDSLVLELRWRDVSILLTGDIGRAPERAIANTIAPAGMRVVKIPHHGSLTSSTEDFVRAMGGRIAVVSAGRSNHFGHPVPEVLQHYQAAGAEVFRTDRDGAVTVDTDGSSVSVRTFAGRILDLPRKHENTK